MIPPFVTGGASAAQLNLLVDQSNADHDLIGSLPGMMYMESAAVNLGDFGSSTMADWITGITVPVPTFAADGTHFLDVAAWANPLVITAISTWTFRMVADSTPGPTGGGGNVLAVPASLPMCFAGMTNYAVPSGATSVAVKMQAQRATGASGAIRLNTTSNGAYVAFASFHS